MTMTIMRNDCKARNLYEYSQTYFICKPANMHAFMHTCTYMPTIHRCIHVHASLNEDIDNHDNDDDDKYDGEDDNDNGDV